MWGLFFLPASSKDSSNGSVGMMRKNGAVNGKTFHIHGKFKSFMKKARSAHGASRPIIWQFFHLRP
jgi:hypothetical protein